MGVVDDITELLGLSDAESAELFGIDEELLPDWRAGEFPAECGDRLETLRTISRSLYAFPQAHDVGHFVRAPQPALGGRSILGALREPDGPHAVGAFLRGDDAAARRALARGWTPPPAS